MHKDTVEKNTLMRQTLEAKWDFLQGFRSFQIIEKPLAPGYMPQWNIHEPNQNDL